MVTSSWRRFMVPPNSTLMFACKRKWIRQFHYLQFTLNWNLCACSMSVRMCAICLCHSVSHFEWIVFELKWCAAWDGRRDPFSHRSTPNRHNYTSSNSSYGISCDMSSHLIAVCVCVCVCVCVFLFNGMRRIHSFISSTHAYRNCKKKRRKKTHTQKTLRTIVNVRRWRQRPYVMKNHVNFRRVGNMYTKWKWGRCAKCGASARATNGINLWKKKKRAAGRLSGRMRMRVIFRLNELHEYQMCSVGSSNSLRLFLLLFLLLFHRSQICSVGYNAPPPPFRYLLPWAAVFIPLHSVCLHTKCLNHNL